MVTLLDTLLAGGVAITCSSSCFLLPRVVLTGSVLSSSMMFKLGVEGLAAAAGFRPRLLGPASLGVVTVASGSVEAVSSCSSSTRVGREARDSAVSTSSARTEVLCLLPLGVLRGVRPVMRPPSGAELRSGVAPDSLRDLRTGVRGSPDPLSLEDTRLVLLVGVRGPSSFRGVMCLGREESLAGVIRTSASTGLSLNSTFFEDLLVLFGVSGFGLSVMLVSLRLDLLDLLTGVVGESLAAVIFFFEALDRASVMSTLGEAMVLFPLPLRLGFSSSVSSSLDSSSAS